MPGQKKKGAPSLSSAPLVLMERPGRLLAAIVRLTQRIATSVPPNPFNRTNDATVNASFASLESMLLGTLSGETSVAVQPYWSSTLNDYLSAS